MTTFGRAVACSLGFHGLLLAAVLALNTDVVMPVRAPDALPFLRASLIYVRSSQNVNRKSAASPVYIRDRKVDDRFRFDDDRPLIHRAAAEVRPNAADRRDARDSTAEIVEKTAAVSVAYVSSAGSDAGMKAASRHAVSMDRSDALRPGGSEQMESPRATLPRYVAALRPAYPEAARMRGYEGVVLLAVEVMTDGRVGRIGIKRTSGYAMLDQSALKAVREWRFEPARKANLPLAITVDIPVRFSLDESH